MMSCIDILKGLLQSSHKSGSNGISFVMLSALVSEPSDAKLSTLVDGRNVFTMGRGLRLRTKMSIKKYDVMYWHFERFTAIYTQFWFKWYIICHAECTGPRAFRHKTFHIVWRQKFFLDRPRIQAMYKNDHKKSMMSCTDILKGLLQSSHNPGSNGVSFVMLTALVPEPFDAKLSILVDGKTFFWIGRWFRRCTKMTIKKYDVMYWYFEKFTAIYIQFWFKWYLICHAECTGPRAFRRKTFHIGWRMKFFGIGRGFRRCPKMTIRIEMCHILKFLIVYCNLYIIMVQIIYNLSSWVPWSQSLSTQNFRHKHTHKKKHAQTLTMGTISWSNHVFDWTVACH